MGHEWIIDVLTDLRSFARKHDLPLLEDQLAQTTQVASVEIAAASKDRSLVVIGNGCHDRSDLARSRAN